MALKQMQLGKMTKLLTINVYFSNNKNITAKLPSLAVLQLCYMAICTLHIKNNFIRLYPVIRHCKAHLTNLRIWPNAQRV